MFKCNLKAFYDVDDLCSEPLEGLLKILKALIIQYKFTEKEFKGDDSFVLVFQDWFLLVHLQQIQRKQFDLIDYKMDDLPFAKHSTSI